MTLKKKEFNKTYFVVLLFLTISSLLILVWFRDGFFYGGGDVGLPTYNPKRSLEITKNIWWEAQAPGFLIPQSVTSITLYLFLSFFQFFGLGPVGMQAILFLVLLFLMGFGMYLLILSIIGHDKKIYATVGGLFYMFNPYMMVQIWHRFNNTSFFFVAAIPYLIMFWIGWIKSGNYLNLLFFLIVNLLASYMFGTLAYVIPLWLIIFLFTISAIFFPWENKGYLFRVFIRGLFGLGMWILVNGWWLIPVATIGSGVTSQQHNIGESLTTFLAISEQAILPYSLQMINPFYVFAQAELGEIYKSFFFRLIPWLGIVVIFYGIIRALQRKYLAFYVLIYFVIIMLSKGNSPPFGQFFLFLFSKFFVFGLLRNPFEKIGILLPLINSILFIVGIEGFVERFRKYLGNFGTISILVALFTVLGVYYWPMYRGTIFGTIGHPNYVEIPQSYKDADNWLNQRVHNNSQTDGRILHLPLTRSDIVTYSWKYGYHGSEPSSLLFTSLPSISHGLNLPRIDDSLTALSLIFNYPYNLHHEKILKLLQDFNVRYIILHKDIIWKGSDIYNPYEIEKILDALSFLEREIQFGDLVLYEIRPEYFQPKVILTNAIDLVYPENATMRLLPYLISDNSNYMITPVGNNANKIIPQSAETIIFPSQIFTYQEASESGMDYVVNKLVQDYNILNRAKPYIERDNDSDAKSLLNQLQGASENLVNIYIVLINNHLPQVDSFLKAYQENMTSLLSQDLRNPKFSIYVSPSYIDNFYKHHLLILQYLELKLKSPQNQIIQPYIDKIKKDLISLHLVPIYPLASKDNLVALERQINQFNIFQKGRYELLMVNSRSRDIYLDKLDRLDFQINDKAISLQANERGDVISFGNIDLNEGVQEVSFKRLISENQFSTFDQLAKVGNVKILDQNTIQLSSDGIQPAYVDSQLTNIVGEESYLVTFEASIQSGTGFYVQIIQDTDSLQVDKPNPLIKASVYRTSQDINWQTYEFQLPSLNLTTRKAVFRLIVDPTGTTSFGDIIDNQSTIVSIKNVHVGRVLNNPIYLYSKSQSSIASTSAEIIQFKEETPVLYTGRVKIDQPTFLIFKEAFYPGWKLELKKEGKDYKTDQHYIANLYGNAWWVEEPGEYDFKIKFEPQSKVTLGIYLTILGGGVLLFLTIFQRIKKYERN